MYCSDAEYLSRVKGIARFIADDAGMWELGFGGLLGSPGFLDLIVGCGFGIFWGVFTVTYHCQKIIHIN